MRGVIVFSLRGGVPIRDRSSLATELSQPDRDLGWRSVPKVRKLEQRIELAAFFRQPPTFCLPGASDHLHGALHIGEPNPVRPQNQLVDWIAQPSFQRRRNVPSLHILALCQPPCPMASRGRATAQCRNPP
jgi:hypothetical protein